MTPNLPQIILRETDWLVVDKPAGLSVHNQPGADLLSWVETECKTKAFPIHRLDQETSGLMVLALSALRAQELQQVLSHEKSLKTYTVILRGLMKPPLENGLWQWPISDKAEGRKNPQGLSHERKEATTKWHLIQSTKYFTKLECVILTGRQHQIRKHAALAKQAVVGDDRYGDNKYNQMILEKYHSPRLFLHASQLKLQFGQNSLEFSSPLPSIFDQLLLA